MKSIISYPILFLLGFTIWFASCQKEEITESLEVAQLEEDLLQTRVKIDTVVPIFKPDLVVAIKTNVTAMTNSCGPTLPDVSCYGQHSFTATAIVSNIGLGNLPPGTVKVKWTLNNGSPLTQFLPHNGIPAGTSVRVSRPYYLGPCDCGPPPATYFLATIDAEVDPNDEIDEKKENNNNATPYVAFDGC